MRKKKYIAFDPIISTKWQVNRMCEQIMYRLSPTKAQAKVAKKIKNKYTTLAMTEIARNSSLCLSR